MWSKWMIGNYAAAPHLVSSKLLGRFEMTLCKEWFLIICLGRLWDKGFGRWSLCSFIWLEMQWDMQLSWKDEWSPSEMCWKWDFFMEWKLLNSTKNSMILCTLERLIEEILSSYIILSAFKSSWKLICYRFWFIC